MVNQKKKKKNYKTNKQTKPPKQQTKCYISRTLTNFLKTQKMCFSICIIQVKGLCHRLAQTTTVWKEAIRKESIGSSFLPEI